MTDNDCFRVLDELLRDIMRKVDDALHMVPFVGKTMVMTGDFRQILPVVPRGSRAAIGASNLNKSYPWPYFKTLRLTTNIHVEGTNVDARLPAGDWPCQAGRQLSVVIQEKKWIKASDTKTIIRV